MREGVWKKRKAGREGCEKGGRRYHKEYGYKRIKNKGSGWGGWCKDAKKKEREEKCLLIKLG